MHDITDRGFIAAGNVADITIFDPDTITEKPREPVASLPGGGVQVKREPVGIDHVIVSGTVLLENGEVTGALSGQIIRGPLYQGAQASPSPTRRSAPGPPLPHCGRGGRAARCVSRGLPQSAY